LLSRIYGRCADEQSSSAGLLTEIPSNFGLGSFDYISDESGGHFRVQALYLSIEHLRIANPKRIRIYIPQGFCVPARGRARIHVLRQFLVSAKRGTQGTSLPLSRSPPVHSVRPLSMRWVVTITETRSRRAEFANLPHVAACARIGPVVGRPTTKRGDAAGLASSRRRCIPPENDSPLFAARRGPTRDSISSHSRAFSGAPPPPPPPASRRDGPGGRRFSAAVQVILSMLWPGKLHRSCGECRWDLWQRRIRGSMALRRTINVERMRKSVGLRFH